MSISAALATPSASILIASLPSVTPSLLVANPATSFTKIVVLPIAEPINCAAVMVESEHLSWRISSSKFMIGTGLKKCIPTILSAQPVAWAIADIGSPDVLVARIACTGAKFSNSQNMFCFNLRISGTASITKSVSVTASAISEYALKFADHSAFCLTVVFPRAIPLSQKASIIPIPLSNPSGKASKSRVSQPV